MCIYLCGSPDFKMLIGEDKKKKVVIYFIYFSSESVFILLKVK